MNLDHVAGLRFADVESEHPLRDTLLYALALGYGQDPLDEAELPYVVDGLPGRPLRVVPTQAVILGWLPFWHDDPRAAIDWRRILHGEQHLRLHAPLPAELRVRATHRLVAVQDKGVGRGALLQVDTELFDRDRDTHLASLCSLQFLRGDGGCGDWGTPTTPALPAIADDARPTATVELPTSPQAALLYRAACRDPMPIHADPAIARAAGFPRPISHGLNNLGLACRAILRATGAVDAPARLREIAVRFVRPGLPGDTLRVEVFDRGAGRLHFRATALERGVRLLDRGVCRMEAARGA